MNVLLLHNYYQSKMIGGEDLVVKRELAGLVNLLGSEHVFQYTVSNNDIHRVKLLKTIWGDKSHAKAVYELVKSKKIDLVHVHNFFPLLTPLVFKAAQDAGAKVVHTLHNYRNVCLSGLLYREAKPWCVDCVSKKLMWPGVLHGCYRNSKIQSGLAALSFAWYKRNDYFKYIDYYFALTEFQKKLLLNLGFDANKIIVKPNGIDRPIGRGEAQRKGFLFVGRLEAAKGIESLLAIWQKLDLPLWVIGGPVERFKDYQHPSVTFLGQLSHQEVLQWMGQVKYLIHPALAVETFGLNIIEAMAEGTPVIGFNRGTRQEFIEHEKNGFLCEPEDLLTTVQKADLFQEYSTLSEQARVFAKQYFSEKIMNEQVAWYQKIKSA